LGIMAVRFSLAVQRDDVLVVIDRALRPDAADHPQRFQQCILSRSANGVTRIVLARTAAQGLIRERETLA
jgi:hypothetical protein